MDFMVVDGANHKQFIQIWNAKMNELPYLKNIEQIVSRREYKPWSQGFNKWVSQSYFINETFIPTQFWPDVKRQMEQVMGPIKLINEEKLYFNIDRDEFNEWIYDIQLPEKYDLTKEAYAYQPESVYQSLTNKIARIEIGTGGGKTLITYLYCKWLLEHWIKPDRQILMVVPRKDLAIQLKNDFAEYDTYIDNKIRVESIYSGSKRYLDAHVVVGTYQSLKEYDEAYFNDFDVLICDEVHTGKAYSVRCEIYDKCKFVQFAFGMSGTMPEYPTLDYLNVVSMFGPTVVTKKTWELIRDGNVVPVKIQAIEITYADEYNSYSKNLVEQGIIGTEKYRAEKVFFETFEPRNSIIAKLCNFFPGNHLILVESVAFCKYLKDFLQERCPSRYVDIIHGKINNREEIKQTMKAVDNMILIATYETMSTGVSIPTIWHVHFPDGGKSPYRVNQGTGRSIRLDTPHGKTHANVFDYQDMMPGSTFKNHARIRTSLYVREKHPIKVTKITIGNEEKS